MEKGEEEIEDNKYHYEVEVINGDKKYNFLLFIFFMLLYCLFVILAIHVNGGIY